MRAFAIMVPFGCLSGLASYVGFQVFDRLMWQIVTVGTAYAAALFIPFAAYLPYGRVVRFLLLVTTSIAAYAAALAPMGVYTPALVAGWPPPVRALASGVVGSVLMALAIGPILAGR